jgi:peptidoglycan/LPS O-acetylase OafA/YrhL
MVPCAVAIYAAAYLLYRCWERPWLTLRDRNTATVPAI